MQSGKKLNRVMESLIWLERNMKLIVMKFLLLCLFFLCDKMQLWGKMAAGDFLLNTFFVGVKNVNTIP